jgi:hypothetical protein
MFVEIILLNVIVMSGTTWWLSKRQPESTRLLFWASLTVKLLAGIAVGVVYFYYYNGKGDTVIYWRDGVLLADKIISRPMDGLGFFWDENVNPEFIDGLFNLRPRSLFFVKISGLLAILSWNSYWVMALQISFVSFLGAWYLFNKVILFFPSSRCAAAASFLFYPSVVFWSSGLIKESLGMATLFFLAGIFLLIINNHKIRVWEWVVTILSLWIGWNLKYYWMGVFIPIVITTIVIMKLRQKNAMVARFDLAVWASLFLIILLIGTNLHPNFYLSRFLDVIVQNNNEFMMLTDPGNAVLYQDLNPSLTSILMNAPQALVAGFFRPFIWDESNFLSIVAGIENFVFLIMMGLSLPSLFRFLRSPDRLLAMATITYSIILAIFLALSTPNLGTLSRYKIGFLPFLVFLILNCNPIINRLAQRKNNTD